MEAVEQTAHITHISNVLVTICTGMIRAELSKTVNIAQTDVLATHAQTTIAM